MGGKKQPQNQEIKGRMDLTTNNVHRLPLQVSSLYYFTFDLKLANTSIPYSLHVYKHVFLISQLSTTSIKSIPG